jgi:hypothetical protein
MRRRGLAAALLLATLLSAVGCRERGRPDPDIQMAMSHEREEAAQKAVAGNAAPAGAEVQGGPGQKPAVPTRLEVPDAVKQAYSGVALTWRDATKGQEGKLEVPFGASVELPGSGLSVAADVYLPAFTMSADVITSTGVEEQNPAARIRVGEGGKEVFGGWIFKRFPDVHPFTHPRFSLRLVGGIRTPGK